MEIPTDQRVSSVAVDPALLAAVPLFDGLSFAQLSDVARLVAVQSWPKGAIVVHEGDPGNSIQIVIAGSVSVVRIAPDGRETILSILKEGDFYGEMSVLDASARSASIRALTPVRVGVIAQSAMLDLLERDASISRAFMLHLCRRLRQANAVISATTSGDMRCRLALLLLNLAENFGETVPEGLRIKLRFTNQQMADMVGTTRETVNRTLNRFWDEQCIDMRTPHIIITNLPYLSALAP